MKLTTCIHCDELYLEQDEECPHCKENKEVSIPSSSYKTFTRSALLLGLALTGCGDKTEDTATDTASEPTSEPAVEPPYGVPDTGDADEVEE